MTHRIKNNDIDINHQKVKHLVESSKFLVIIYIDHLVTINICKEKLIIFINFSIRSNIRFIRAFQYLSQFSFDVKHKSSKNNILSNVLSRLSSIDVVLFETNDYSKFNVLHVDAMYSYNTTLIEFNKNFKNKIVQENASNSKKKTCFTFTQK